jgi:hypothetical protein
MTVSGRVLRVEQLSIATRFAGKREQAIVALWVRGWSRKLIAAAVRRRLSRVRGVLLLYCQQELVRGRQVDGGPSYFWRITRKLYPDAPIEPTDPRARSRRWSAEGSQARVQGTTRPCSYESAGGIEATIRWRTSRAGSGT